MSAYSDSVISDAPVAYWRLGESSGSSTAVDQMGVQNGVYGSSVVLGIGGVLVGDVAFAAGFDGTGSSYVSLASNAALNITGSAISIELWLNVPNGPHSQYLYCAFTVNNGFALTLGFVGQNKLGYWDGQGSSVGGPIVSDSNWHHLVAVASGTSVTFYVDTVPDGPYTIISPSVTFTGSRYIGAFNSSSGQNVNGLMQELAVYNIALGIDRIAAHYLLGRPAGDIPTPASRGGH